MTTTWCLNVRCRVYTVTAPRLPICQWGSVSPSQLPLRTANMSHTRARRHVRPERSLRTVNMDVGSVANLIGCLRSVSSYRRLTRARWQHCNCHGYMLLCLALGDRDGACRGEDGEEGRMLAHIPCLWDQLKQLHVVEHKHGQSSGAVHRV